MNINNQVLKTISVFGCGWLGKPLAMQLVSKGYHVKGSTTTADKLAGLGKGGVEPFLIQADPAPRGERLDEFFNSGILIITIPPRRKSNGAEFFIRQMQEVESICRIGSVRRVLFVSSTSVYDALNRVVVENDASPLSYMVQAENVFRNSHELKTTVLRFGGLVGPGRHPGRFLSGKEVQGGDEPVNIIHLTDCIRIIEAVIEKEKWGEVFNACADQHPSKREYYTHASMQLGMTLPFFGSNDSPFKIVSNEHVKKELNYQFVFPDPMTMKY
jgi:nucleoside-diphosphate-sugar epimerase